MVTTDVNTVTYNGNGSNTAFPFTFKIQDASEINLQLVYADGTVTDITSDYYVDTVNSTVHYPGYAPGSEPAEADQPAPVQTGQKLTIWRDVPMTQEADLGDKWPFEEIENGLDKLTMICQQIYAFTNRKLDAALASMGLLADVVVDSEELQHITDQLNAIDANAAAAAESEENAATSATAAAESATASANSANDSAGSAASATDTANALINFLETKETLTAPAVDPTLTITGAAADAQVTGDYIDSVNTQIQSLHSVAVGGALVEGTARDTSVKIGACTVALNGTASGFMVLSLQETPLKAYTSATNFTDSCTVSNTLLAGHTYKLHAILVSGTIIDSHGTYKPGFTIGTNIRLYGYADGHNTLPAVLNSNNETITPETDTVVGALVYLVASGVIFNNAVITAYIEDVTLTSKLDTTDKTLSIEGLPADAKQTGDVITSLKNLTVKTVLLPYTWEHGGISTGGEPSSDNKRVRTQALWIDPTVNNVLVCDPSVQVRILYFNEPIIRHAYFVKINAGWTNTTQQLEGGYYAALVAKYTNSPSTEITDLTPFASLVKVEKETAIVNDYSELKNKKVAIIGDSISTNGNYSESNPLGNVPEIIITENDVGVNLSAYATYYDIGTTVGGHTITAEDVGTEITFTPVAEDVGKMVGVPKNNNAASVVVWWEVLKNELGIEPIPVAWSGSSITSHEGNKDILKTSYAWHPAQIRKCGIRVDGSMERIAPDIVVIYRGTNDFSHQPYARLTPNYFDQYPCTIPETDYDSENNIYGYIEGLCMTIQKLKEAYPKAQIFLATLNFIKRVSYSNFPTRNGYNTVPQYNNAIRATADYFGLPIIDFAKDGLDFWNVDNTYYQDSTAYTHPTTKGHAVLAQRALKDIVNGYVDINV